MNYPIWDLPILGGGVLIGTIAILHVFVWVWAMEWVAFFTEIAAAFVYYYGWDRLSRRAHLAVGWIYFGGAWLSLFQINGILTFMLTPGQWLQSRSLADAFFNPTMRKPYIIYGYMWSNSIRVADEWKLQESGLLPRAKWVAIPYASLGSQLRAGEEIFQVACQRCSPRRVPEASGRWPARAARRETGRGDRGVRGAAPRPRRGKDHAD